MNTCKNNENNNNGYIDVTSSHLKTNGELLKISSITNRVDSSPNFLSQSQQEVQLNYCSSKNNSTEKELNNLTSDIINMDNNLTKKLNENHSVQIEKHTLNNNNEGFDVNDIKYQIPHPQQQNEKMPQRYYYISLAKESPNHSINFDEDSDSSTYGTINCLDTEVCKDSSDTESYSSLVTDGIATIEVLEYEVESSSSPNQLYSEEDDSSSGTDEFVLNSALTARVYAKDILAFNNSKFQYWSSEFADTEDEASSSSSYDYELSKDDYWTCIKCKNTSNNPKCRYCEKCYQIRKSHFPPRPRKYRSRQQRRKRKINNLIEDDTLSLKSNEEDDVPAPKQMKRRSGEELSGINKALNSAAESNSSSSSDDENIKSSNSSLNSTKKFRRNISNLGRLTKMNSGLDNFIKSDNYRISVNSVRNESTNINANCRKRKLSNNNGSNFSSSSIKKLCDNIYDSETDLYPIKLAKHFLRDSGISSAPSSQELPGTSSGTSISSADEQYKLSNITKYLKDHKKLLEIKNMSDKKKLSNSKHLSDATLSDEFEEHELLELEENNIQKAVSDSLNIKSHDANIETTEISLALPSVSNSNTTLSRYFSEIPQTEKLISNNDNEEFLPFRASSVVDNFNYDSTMTLNKIEQRISNSQDESCLICLSAPKNCVFAHSKYVCSFCCYKCAKRVWSRNNRCPICNCAVRNIMKLFGH